MNRAPDSGTPSSQPERPTPTLPNPSGSPVHRIDAGKPGEPARHNLRRRTVDRFRSHPDEPRGAIPLAVKHVIGGPMMWSDKPVRETQFTAEQRDLVVRAAQEIEELYLAAGGRMEPRMLRDDALGLMPDNSAPFPYQSEEWAAAKAINAGRAVEVDPRQPEPTRRQAELARAYYIVITWIDYVKDGLLDASEIYEDEEDGEA